MSAQNSKMILVKSPKVLTLMLLIAATAHLNGCGNKGKLYLPEKQAQQTSAQSAN